MFTFNMDADRGYIGTRHGDRFGYLSAIKWINGHWNWIRSLKLKRSNGWPNWSLPTDYEQFGLYLLMDLSEQGTRPSVIQQHGRIITTIIFHFLGISQETMCAGRGRMKEHRYITRYLATDSSACIILIYRPINQVLVHTRTGTLSLWSVTYLVYSYIGMHTSVVFN